MRSVASRAVKHLADSFHGRSAVFFSALFFVGDFVFVVLHVVNARLGLHEMLSLETDRGYAEAYQYLKYAGICTLIVVIARRSASRRYLVWLPLFGYFLLDDALNIHERGGDLVVKKLGGTSYFGWIVQPHGELLVSAPAGIVLLSAVAAAYRNGTQAFRKTSQDLALLTAVLLFFGVVVDTARGEIRLGEAGEIVLGTIEDGGELCATSLILSYLPATAIRRSKDRRYLCDAIRSAFAESSCERPDA